MAGRIGYDTVVFSVVARRDGFEQSGAPRDDLAAESRQSVLADLSCVAAVAQVAPPPPPPGVGTIRQYAQISATASPPPPPPPESGLSTVAALSKTAAGADTA